MKRLIFYLTEKTVNLQSRKSNTPLSDFLRDTSNTGVSIDDVINHTSDPAYELVINSHKNMNNGNNCEILEENIVESDINTTEIIADDSNNDLEKKTKQNQTGKLGVDKNNEKQNYLGRKHCIL